MWCSTYPGARVHEHTHMQHIHTYTKWIDIYPSFGARKVAQCLRVCTAVIEDLSSVPGTDTEKFTTALTSAPGGYDTLLWPPLTLQPHAQSHMFVISALERLRQKTGELSNCNPLRQNNKISLQNNWTCPIAKSPDCLIFLSGQMYIPTTWKEHQ